MSWFSVQGSEGGRRRKGKLGEGERKLLGKLTIHRLHPPPFQGPPALAFLSLTAVRHFIGA